MSDQKDQKDQSANPSTKYFADQFDDESVEFVFRKHPIVMRRGLIVGCFALLLGTVPVLITLQNKDLVLGLLGGFILGVILFTPSWIKWYFSVFIVTDQRFIQIRQKGLFHRSVSDIGLNQIQSMNYAITGFIQTVLGFGTIVVQTYMGDIEIYEVHYPAKTQNRIQAILRQQGIDPTPLRAELPGDSSGANSNKGNQSN